MPELIGNKNISTTSILEAFLAGTHDAFLVLDNNCKIVTTNQKYIHLHQRFSDNKPLQGINYINLIKGSLLNFLDSHLTEILLDKKPQRFSQKIYLGIDHIEWFDVSLTPLLAADNVFEGVALGLFEATEKYQSIEQTRKSEELFKNLVLNSTDAFQLTNDELKILYISDSVKNVLGYDSSELKDNYFFNFIHADDKSIISNWLYGLLNHPGIVKTVEVRIKNKKDDWIYIEVNGNNLLDNYKVASIVINFRDIQAKKVAEKALYLAEQRMSLLLNNTRESFIILNSRLRVITYNKAAQEHSPKFFSQELQSGISILDLIPENEIEEIINTFESVFEGQESEKETYFKSEGGEFFCYNHNFRPLFHNNDIVGVFMTSTDVTEKRKAQQKLIASEEKNRTIIRESFDAILIKNHENIIIEASPVVEKVLGYTAEELIGNKCFDFIYPEDKEKTTEAFNFINLSYGNETNIDVRILNKHGDYVWVELKGKNMYNNQLIQGMIVTLRDITFRKKAEEVITFSEQRFKGLVQSGGDIITIVDRRGSIQYLSPSVKTVLGDEPQDFIDRQIFEYVHPDDIPYLASEFNNMLDSNTKQIALKAFRYKNSKHEYSWLEAVVTNMYDDPAIKGIVINSRDITERKRLYEHQQSLTEELIKNNQDLQQFSFITSHNLRAPVANLIGLLNLYNKEEPADDFNAVLVEKFGEATQQLNTTLNDLLEVLVLKSNTNIEKETLSLHSILEKVYLNLDNNIRSSSSSIEANFAEIDTVVYNKLHLESIFQNLISNAIKYRSVERNLELEISSHINEEWIILKFKDNGIGIDLARYKDRIFGLYQRFHADREGKGLGLYMIKAQINSMGGKIEVDSELGVGTTFKIYISKHG